LRKFLLALTVVSLFAASTARATPSSVPAAPLPFVDGFVRSALVEGDTLYVGGNFSVVGGTPVGSLGLFDAGDATVRRTFTGFTGKGEPTTTDDPSLHIGALVPDGAGGWYAGGAFDRVNGAFRNSLVHLLADGSVDPDFRADVAGPITALALDGDRLFVAGLFWTVSGERAWNLAAVDARTGARAPWHTDLSWETIGTLAVDGDRLYVGGPGAAALDTRTGARLAWDPQLSRGQVNDIAVAGDVVYLAADTGARAVRRADGQPLPLTFAGVPAPTSVVVTPGAVVWGNGYDAEHAMTASDPQTGADRGWFRDVPAAATRALAVDGNRLFALAGGVRAFDVRDGSALAWDPHLTGAYAITLAAADGVVALAGSLGSLGGVTRRNLAAFDLATGAVKPFRADPATNPARLDTPQVNALVMADGTLYAGGRFDTIGGAEASNLAALDPVTGASVRALPPLFTVNALALSGSTLFAGGGSLVSYGQLAAIDLPSGSKRAWAPDFDSYVYALLADGGKLHVGGRFSEQLVDYRLDDLTRVPAPHIYGHEVDAIIPDGRGGLFYGGDFDELGGLPAANIAHVDASGHAVPGAPVTDGTVRTLHLDGDVLSVGGEFTHLQAQPRTHAGQVNLGDGSVTTFAPEPDGWPTAFIPRPDGGLLMPSVLQFTGLATPGGLVRFGPAVPTSAPGVRRAPRVAGETAIGGGQWVDADEWTGPVSFREIRWLRCDAAGTGCVATCTGSHIGYTIRDADAGHRLRAEVRATNDGGTTVARSEPGPLIDGMPVPPDPGATPYPDPTPSATATPSPTATPVPSPTPTATATPVPSPTPSATATPVLGPTPVPSGTATPPTTDPRATATPVPSPTPTALLAPPQPRPADVADPPIVNATPRLPEPRLVVSRSRVTVTLTAPAQQRLTVRLLLNNTRIGRATLRKGAKRVTVALTRKGRMALRRHRTVTVEVRGPAGTTRTRARM